MIKKLTTAALCSFSIASQSPAQLEYVDPTIGGVGVLLEPTRPTVHLPHSMVRVYPVRRDALDDQIQSFPLTIISHRLGELFSIMPHDGAPDAASWKQAATYDLEKTTPYYYSTRLDDSLIQVEFTPTERCGYFRFKFPSGKPVVLLANRKGGDMTMIGDRAVSGVEHFNGMQAFIYGEFSSPVTVVRTVDGDNSRLAVSGSGEALEFRYGVSFISVEQAKRNLSNEITGDFEKTKLAAHDVWNKALGRIKVEGGTPDQKRVFYTALYRCYERMVNISEDGQYYSGFDHKVHQDKRPFYVDNWLWDNFRALEPLQTLLDPAQQADKIQSYVRMYEQSGWMPSFAVSWGDHACMTGNQAAPWIADSWFKGVKDFDLPKAYEGLRKNSLDATLLPWRNGPKTSLDDFYNKNGYLPALRSDEKETVAEVHEFERCQSVAVTLENSYDDWNISQLARALDKGDDHELFLKRAGYYKNLYRAEKGFVWPKDAAGKWIEDFDPKFSGGMGGRAYTTENNAYTYNWDVQHDFKGLAELMGGKAAAGAKLDNLFCEELGRSKYAFFSVFPDSTAMVGQYSMGNEPSFATPYIYNHLGAPWKTQKRIRQLLEYAFTDTLSGIPGDEDGGGMSAFVVFSMMGFYPVVPGVPVYEFGSPVFEKVSIDLQNGKSFEINAKATSRDNKYIKCVKLNGRPGSALWFRHSEILDGLTIEMEMSDTPNTKLGTAEAELPPSAMSVDPDIASLAPCRAFDNVSAWLEMNIISDFLPKPVAIAMLCIGLGLPVLGQTHNVLDQDDLIVAVRNAVRGGPNSPSDAADSSDQEQVAKAIDGKVDSKHYSKAADSGLVVSPGLGASIVTGIRFATGNDLPERDPLAIIIEGSNDSNPTEPGVSGFTLLHEGQSGLEDQLDRGKWGRTIHFENTAAYKSYRVLISQTRGGKGTGAQYGEVELLGVPEIPSQPRIVHAPPATQRIRIDDKWSDRALLVGQPAVVPADTRNLLWYRQPAKVWEEALPVGNGRLGAMVFGGIAN